MHALCNTAPSVAQSSGETKAQLCEHSDIHWGEPERAPHDREGWRRDVQYIYYWGEHEQAPH